ncbi:hypothetical protein Bca4012_014721 [Brassica carinata]
MKLLGGTPCESTPSTPDWKEDGILRGITTSNGKDRFGVRNRRVHRWFGFGLGIVCNFGIVCLAFHYIWCRRVGIWCVCVQRQKAINAGNINNFPGQVVGAQVASETHLKTVQKGDAGYKV